jgi:hypothetical protein
MIEYITTAPTWVKVVATVWVLGIAWLLWLAEYEQGAGD